MNRKLKAKIVEEFGTQADFAQVMNLDEGVISRVVRGRRVLSPEDAAKWASVLGCDRSVMEKEMDQTGREHSGCSLKAGDVS